MPKYVHDVQKKQHRERAQPTERKRFGLLQKKKDYKLRAKDYHEKQDRLKVLREKAKTKNPDEYYHSMTSKKTDSRGILMADRGNETLSVDEVKLLKTQDVNYIRTKRLNEIKQTEKLQDILGFKSESKHTVFVEDKQEFENFDASEFFNTDERFLSRKENRLRLDQIIDKLQIDVNENRVTKQNTKKLKQLKQLKERLERVEKLANVELKMNQQRELMKKGSKKKVVNKEGKVSFKWKNQRKK